MYRPYLGFVLHLHLSAMCTSVSALTNTALVFIKPHASTDVVAAFVRDHLVAAGLSIIDEGVKSAKEIDSRKLIDQHYGSLARLAMDVPPSQLDLAPSALSAFESTFGTSWKAAMGSVMTNTEALASLGVDGLTLEQMWRDGLELKLAPGTYISRLKKDGDALYTINGFYPAMRQAFVTPGASVRYLVCEWDEADLSWQDFRRDVIGATDPRMANVGSCRNLVLSRWEELGLPEAPGMPNNGVHASAGPLEGLRERAVWCDLDLTADALAQHLYEAGLEPATLDAWLTDNPKVTLGGETDKVFDLTEEMGAEAVVELVRTAMGRAYSYTAAEVMF